MNTQESIDQIRWARGNFRKFYARMKIRVGATPPVDIEQGDEFEYDGTILKYGGAEIPQPQMRGAFRSGWVEFSGQESNSKVSPVRPSRNVAEAKSVNRDLNRVQRQSGRSAMETSALDEQTVLDVEDRRPGSSTNPNAKPRIVQGSQRNFAVETEDPSDGVTVGEVRTRSRVKIEDMTKVSSQQIQAIEEATLGRPIMYKRDRPQGSSTVSSEGISMKVTSSVDSDSVLSGEEDGVVVANVRNTSIGGSDGISVRDTSNIRSQKAQAPKFASAPKLDQNLPPKVRIARAIDPSFPADWNFGGKLAERLERVKAHGAKAQFLNALYAAEGDQMRKKLEETYPKHFR